MKDAAVVTESIARKKTSACKATQTTLCFDKLFKESIVPDDDSLARLIQSRFKLIFNFQYGGEADEKI